MGGVHQGNRGLSFSMFVFMVCSSKTLPCCCCPRPRHRCCSEIGALLLSEEHIMYLFETRHSSFSRAIPTPRRCSCSESRQFFSKRRHCPCSEQRHCSYSILFISKTLFLFEKDIGLGSQLGSDSCLWGFIL